MPTDTKLNQLIINQLTQEQYDGAKAAGTLSDTELYITDSDDDPQVKSNLSQTIDDSTTKYPSNKAVKDESSRITTLMNTKVSNCITEIPQDIKLELNNGTLTLKAGSKVYVPNGFESDGTTKKFDVKIIESDKVWSSRNLNYPQQFVFLKSSQGFEAVGESGGTIYSGSTAPSGKQYMLWYDTTNNFIKWTNDSGSSWISGNSFPLSICSSTQENNWTSIDQVFNGFGYIGSTIFALPGVKGRIPNGRNSDGSLKSIEVIQNSVKTITMASYMAGRKHCPLELFFNNKLGGMEIDFNNWGVVATLKDLPRDKLYAAYYCLEDNLIHYFDYNGIEGINKSLFAATFAVGDDSKITSFTPKTVFHALDYNDKSTISGWSMPSSRYINLTLGASGTTYKAPANGWVILNKAATGIGQEIRLINQLNQLCGYAISASNNASLDTKIPCRKGDNILVYYSASGSLANFRFIYAEGE